ncbi:unnamed protein product [Rotaria magnacalcarata]|uniref:Uncharacterized protein n=1 Tax=Rotaria magnacalcarata TaxID=392030 RepID=A0A818XS14_9BILA|nr:unnamed protein product [Rotaria magnacalcarata]CAF3740529.1 unnamed protein product [Rotaria magnacalcarata]
MCSQSVSGSSLLSGYNEDDARETSGRSRREFEEIDSVLYNEEKPKRSSIKKICEEWSSKPHFRIRGRLSHIERQSTINLIQSYKQLDIIDIDTTTSSTIDLLATNPKFSSLNSNEMNALDDAASGRSSIDSIEGSELNNSDLDDDDDATNTILDDHFSGTAADSFDTDEDDDENNDFSLGISTRDRSKHRHHHLHSKHPQLLIKCMKDSIVNALASELLQQFLSDQQLRLQEYAKLICARNAIKLRPKLRPYSLPPRSLSQNRFSLPTASSIAATSALLQIAPFPIRSTPEPGMKLTGLLRVTPLRITNSGAGSNAPTSPRKTQIPPSLPPPPPPPPPPTERTPTSLILDKRNQQQISLIGISVANPPSHQLTITTTPQSSQSQIRQTPSTFRYRSATTVNTNIQNIESNTRLPPINIERLTSNDQLTINRSNTSTTVIVESVPPATRAVSGTSTGSNLSSTVKLRAPANMGKLQRSSRPISISSINNNKDLNNSSSTSPARSITAANVSSSSLKTTTVSRTQQHHHQKRPLVTTKAPPPPGPGIIKVPAPHIF